MKLAFNVIKRRVTHMIYYYKNIMPKMDVPKYTHKESEISGLNNDDAIHNEDVLVELKKKNDYP